MANLLLLAVHAPGFNASGICGGFVLTSNSGDQMEIAFRKNWEQDVEDEITAAVLNGMETTFVAMAAHTQNMGLSPAAFIHHINTTYSNLIRSVDSIQIHSDLPLHEHALLLRRGLLGGSITTVN